MLEILFRSFFNYYYYINWVCYFIIANCSHDYKKTVVMAMKSKIIIHINKIIVETIHNLTHLLIILLLLKIMYPYLHKN